MNGPLTSTNLGNSAGMKKIPGVTFPPKETSIVRVYSLLGAAGSVVTLIESSSGHLLRILNEKGENEEQI